MIRSDSTARRDSRLAFGLHLPVDRPHRAPRRSRYQAAGFLMLVPGMGSGRCECRNPLALTCREKSACAMSCRDGLPIPGVTNPIRLSRCRRTSRMASAMSLSLPTTTPQSYASSLPSFSRCTARLTSEPCFLGQLTADVGEISASVSRSAAWCSARGCVLALLPLVTDPDAEVGAKLRRAEVVEDAGRLRQLQDAAPIHEGGAFRDVAGVVGVVAHHQHRESAVLAQPAEQIQRLVAQHRLQYGDVLALDRDAA